MSRPVTRSMSATASAFANAIPTPSFRVSPRLTRTERAVARTLASLRNVIVHHDEVDTYADMPALISIEEALWDTEEYYPTVSRVQQFIPLERQHPRPPRVATLRVMAPRKFSKFLRALSDQELGELYRRSHQTLASEVGFTADQASMLHDIYWNRFNQVNRYYSKYNY
jgi:hypothetical protein